MAAALCTASFPLAVQADSSNVVTLGANLTQEQKTSMYEYFGTSADQVETIEVTNADERKYMEGIASEEQIGTRTYSCSYVEPTSDGGIQVKVANLTYVTSSMIASTLTTSGVENCNVVAASPIAVSGTGALTGIMMAYETASGETLDEGQKAAATEELVTTGELADAVGDEAATGIMNDVKEQVIGDGLTDPSEIQDAVTEAAKTYNITLTEDQMNKITSLMENISQYDYDVKALKETLDNLNGESGGFFSKSLKPSLTKSLFSPLIGIKSATVPIADRINSSSKPEERLLFLYIIADLKREIRAESSVSSRSVYLTALEMFESEKRLLPFTEAITASISRLTSLRAMSMLSLKALFSSTSS